MLSCQLRYVAVSWPWCVPLCTCCSWISWHMVAQHVMDTGSLALGCPTLRSGTWLPNAHGCLPCVPVYSAVYIIWSPSTSFILTVILCDIYYYSAALCDVLWTFSTSSTRSSWTVHICLHEHCYCMDIRLLAHLYISTSPRSMFMTLQYYHSRSSRRFTVYSVLPRCVEPFLISWLSGHYALLCSHSWILRAYLSFQYCSIHVHAQLWFRVPYVERYYDILSSVYSTVHDFRHELSVLLFRWCCIPDLHGHSSRDMMIMTWRFLLLSIMDSEYLSCSLCRWL